jgi:hypothetical protein
MTSGVWYVVILDLIAANKIEELGGSWKDLLIMVEK